jgi:DNA-binding transcriptional LysR family regulator
LCLGPGRQAIEDELYVRGREWQSCSHAEKVSVRPLCFHHTAEIAAGKSLLTVRRWRQRYVAKGAEGLLKDHRPWTDYGGPGDLDGEQLRAAVLAGLGITQAPYWLFAADIRAGTVRRILRDHEPARIPISAVRPASRRQPSKVTVFVDFLTELLAETDDLFPSGIDTIRTERLIPLRRN